jgi:hypothetical protein
MMYHMINYKQELLNLKFKNKETTHSKVSIC